MCLSPRMGRTAGIEAGKRQVDTKLDGVNGSRFQEFRCGKMRLAAEGKVAHSAWASATVSPTSAAASTRSPGLTGDAKGREVLPVARLVAAVLMTHISMSRARRA